MLVSSYAPIALFVYARPIHTRLTLEALARNPEAEATDLHVFCDGSRGCEFDVAVAEVRALVGAVVGFRSVTLHLRERNLGLAQNIIDGVTTILADHERIIVVEDDLVVSSGFLAYMNGALEKWAHDERIASIHGYIYPVSGSLPAAFFLRGADCWGWATWRRAWALFRSDGAALLAELEERKLTDDFDFDRTYPYTQMLRDQIAGKNNSWAIRWYASAFLADRLTLYPGLSYVRNIGMDGSGEHCSANNRYDVDLHAGLVDFASVPVKENSAARALIGEFFSRGRRPSFIRRLQRLFIRGRR